MSEGTGCNVPEVSLNIHCTGTHTECVGHLLEKSGSITENLQDLLFSAVLITAKPQLFGDCPDRYHAATEDNESVISADRLYREYKQWYIVKPDALIIRTEPNPEEKQFYKYSDKTCPISFYGKYKCEVEEYLNYNLKKKSCILRLTKVISKNTPMK